MTEMYPECDAEVVWERDGVKFAIVRHNPFQTRFGHCCGYCIFPEEQLPEEYRESLGHYCGYCIFPERFLVEQGYGGMVTYVPVHGGVTYAEKREDGSMAYGFDCAHSGDEADPRCRDINWLRKECEDMAEAIKIAGRYERDYLLAQTNEDRAEVIDRYHREVEERLGRKFDLYDNFGTMLNLLAQQL